MSFNFGWATLDHWAAIIALAGLVWNLWKRVRIIFQQREEDHKKICALWRLCGFNGWDGVERRSRPRVEEIQEATK